MTQIKTEARRASSSKSTNQAKTAFARPADSSTRSSTESSEKDLVLVNFRPETEVKPRVNLDAWNAAAKGEGSSSKSVDGIKKSGAAGKPRKVSRFQKRHLAERDRLIRRNNRAWKKIARSMGLE